ncbi:acyl-CoA carboxylase subunit epsilon [Kitasatospora sp. NPDC008050]|uniref:acyl-CoA carboxylase subunit epsilon n=1 Tax=Kitasatospora sp. NPDC008050 TaxID=3364021 RepID=UPI0036EE8A34
MTGTITLRVLCGNPTAEELAAVIAVLLARPAARQPAGPARLPRRRSAWQAAVDYRAPAAWASV